ncbi:MAG: hypothetical protein J6K88_02475 [Oscillospiraceae bacterium]|nr:hypothetical protein [Oscillospiraceae bacterium]
MKIGKSEIRSALKKLQSFKGAKGETDLVFKENEKWWRMRHWELLPETHGVKPTSAWLFNSIINKHADAMDNFPFCTVLPQSSDDKKAAEVLNKVIPVILEKCDYQKIYSLLWWDKLKLGVSAVGVFWNPDASEGIGDISLQRINPLNLYFEPGILDLEESSDVFYIESVNNELLKKLYPDADLSAAKGFIRPDGAFSDNRSAVINWYYKKNGRLHYCRFVGEELLFSSENEKQYKDTGWYSHGRYPFILDPLFPRDDSPYGFGYIDTMKDTQMYIDILNKCILENAMLSSKKRFFLRDDGSINEGEFLDFSNAIIHSSGNLGEDSIRELSTNPLAGIHMSVLQHKIDELKETSGNRDFSQGSTAQGVTAASAIAALQEAGSKLSRDMLKNSYRSYKAMCYLIIELVRQFYIAPRVFRISGEEFLSFDNAMLKAPNAAEEFGIEYSSREPIFDITVAAEKGSPYSTAANNELAKEFFSLGFFNPERASEALGAIEMMQFEGKEQMKKRIEENIASRVN